MRTRATRSVILVLDENLSGKSILAGLRKANVPARPQTDFMERGIEDTAVFAALAAHPDCYLLTKDREFHRRPMEKHALMKCRIGAFVITAQKNKTGAELVDIICRAWPRIERCARKHTRPFIAKIRADGNIELDVLPATGDSGHTYT